MLQVSPLKKKSQLDQPTQATDQPISKQPKSHARGKRPRGEDSEDIESESQASNTLHVSGVDSSISRLKLCIYLSPNATPENIRQSYFSSCLFPNSILHTNQLMNPSFILPSCLLNISSIYGKVPGSLNLTFKTSHPVENMLSNTSAGQSNIWIPSIRRELEVLSLIDSQMSHEATPSDQPTEEISSPFDDQKRTAVDTFRKSWRDLYVSDDEYKKIASSTVKDYEKLENIYQKQLESLWSLPDEDGWVKMVSNKRGTSSSGVRFKPWKKSDRQALISKRKQEEKTKIPLFYNFQKRVKRRDELSELRRQVENDKKRIDIAQKSGHFDSLIG